MTLYRKRPVIIQAFQWTGDKDQLEDPEWIVEALKSGIAFFDDNVFKIHTLEGDHIVSTGDFIIQGVSGELYPCKPDIFYKTYEVVTDIGNDATLTSELFDCFPWGDNKDASQYYTDN